MLDRENRLINVTHKGIFWNRSVLAVNRGARGHSDNGREVSGKVEECRLYCGSKGIDSGSTKQIFKNHPMFMWEKKAGKPNSGWIQYLWRERADFESMNSLRSNEFW
jgi:hypothetical protein